MGNPLQLPAGYTLETPQDGAPKLPKGYVMESSAPPALPSGQFANDLATTQKFFETNPTYPSWVPFHDTLSKVAGPYARFLVSGGQAAANAITDAPSFVYHAFADAPTLNEAVLTPEQRVVGRLAGVPQAIEAGQAYASGQVSPKGALSVLPEALGQGVGNVAGTAAYARLGSAAVATPGELNRIVPSTTRAGAGLAALEDAYGTHPVDGNRFINVADKMETEVGSTGNKLPGEIGFVRNRFTNPSGKPVTFAEARMMLRQLNDNINFRNPSPTDKLYQRTAQALSQDIMESTGKPSPVAPNGFQADYQNMINETRQGNKAIRFGENFGPYAGAFTGYELGHELGAPIGLELASGYLGKQLGRSVAGGLMRSIIQREGGPPNISTPPTPPSLANVPGTPYTPPSLRMPLAPATTPPTASATPAPVATGAPTSSPSAQGGLTTGPLPARFQPITMGSTAPPAPPPAAATPPPPEAVAAPPTSTRPPSQWIERNQASREAFEKLPKAEQFARAYTDPKTGIPNQRAWQEAPPAGAYGFADVAGLKTLNDAHGTEVGDALINAKIQALKAAGLDPYRIGGDEIGVHGSDPVTLAQQLDKANQILGETQLEGKDARTNETVRYKGAQFRYGTGTTMQEAEGKMMTRKALDKSRGKMGTLIRLPNPPPTE